MANLIGVNLSAGHTGNGNPRRMFLVIDVDGKYPSIVDAVDEGYEGSARVKRQYPTIRLVTERIETTPSEYREYLRRFKELAKPASGNKKPTRSALQPSRRSSLALSARRARPFGTVAQMVRAPGSRLITGLVVGSNPTRPTSVVPRYFATSVAQSASYYGSWWNFIARTSIYRTTGSGRRL